MSELYPVKFEPIYKEKIWGGRSLERLFGRVLPAGQNIGESWELADLAEGVSVVANGPLTGMGLTELTAHWADGLLGGARPSGDGRFPLLLKLLDANDRLSLQVHPDEQAAAEIGPPAAAKTECWYVVESRGGVIYKGVLPGVGPEQFRQAIEADTIEQLVRRVDVAAGDFHYLPAGTVHAIGQGLVIAEVQTPSDTTYRVTDWGRGREIHVERSMQCIRFGLTEDLAPGAGEDTLLATDYFAVSLRKGNDRGVPVAPGLATALMFIGAAGPQQSGQSATVNHAGPIEPEVRVSAGETVLLPAGLTSATVTAPPEWSYLKITLPQQ